MSDGPRLDSGGQPWAGRSLPPSAFAGDDGRADAALTEALGRVAPDGSGDGARVGAGDGDGGGDGDGDGDAEQNGSAEAEVVRALGAARVFVPIVALREQEAEMALITVTGGDGRRALPVFTTPDALHRWRPDARPVPVQARRAAASARAEGCDLLQLDPSGPRPYLVRRPALTCLIEDRPWRPAYLRSEVRDEVTRVGDGLGLLCRCERGAGAELRVVIGLPPGLDAGEVEAIVARFSAGLAASTVVAEWVDSLELSVRPVSPEYRPPGAC